VFVPGKSPVKEQPKILDIIFLGVLHVAFMENREMIDKWLQ
jgi:hypothetical protein